MAQKQDDIQFLKAYLKDLEHFYHKVLPSPIPSDCINPNPERILSGVPSEKKQNQMLINYAERLLSMAKKCKSPAHANRFKRCAELLKEPGFRSKRAARLVARKRWLAELDIKLMAEQTDAANVRTGRVAIIAKENGCDAKLFICLSDDPTSLQSIRRFGEQIKTLRILIAAIEKPVDKSVIPDGAELLTVPQVARMFGWGESVVRQRDKEGRLPAHLRFGGTIQWYKKELENWMKRGCPPREKWEAFKQANCNQTYIEGE